LLSFGEEAEEDEREVTEVAQVNNYHCFQTYAFNESDPWLLAL